MALRNQKFRNFLQVRDPPPKVEPRKCQFFRAMPLEIVGIIHQFLSSEDRACLALSCRRLYQYYISNTKDSKIFLLSSLSRNDLLRRLQNESWVYCNRCDSLHRHTKWERLHIGKKCNPMPSIFKFLPWRPTQPVGKVDICPCSTITFHEKQHPVNYFLSQSAKLKHAICSISSPPGFAHICGFRHPLATVYIKTRARVTYRGTFEVENQFVFQTTKENSSSELFQNISFRLSRTETKSWLKDFFGEAGTKFFIGNESSDWCQCHDWNHTRTRPYSFMILLNRDLGGDTWPCKRWERNCYD